MRTQVACVRFACALLLAVPAFSDVNTYSSSPALFVPETTPGVTTVITVPDTGIVNDVRMTVTLQHPLLADVQLRLTDPSGAVSTTVFNRDGGVGDGLYNVTFSDAAASLPPNFLTNGQCLSNTTFRPSDPFSTFAGVQVHGNWTLTVADLAGPDSSDCDCDGLNVGPPCPRTLDSWSLRIDYTTNLPPVAQCHDVTVSAGPGSCSVPADIDNGSFDPNGDPITFIQTPAGPYGLGSTAVTLTVTDTHAATSSCIGTVTVTAPPLVVSGATATPAALWPPNHKMVNVTVGYGSDGGCGTANCSITSVSSNEAANGSGDGNTSPDWQIVDAHHVNLRAERSGGGTGRVYTITVSCSDSGGHTASSNVLVTVAHSQ